MRDAKQIRQLYIISSGSMFTMIGIAIYIMGNSPSDALNALIQSVGVLVSGVGISLLFFAIMRVKKPRPF